MNLQVVLETGWSALLSLAAQIAFAVALTALTLWKLRDAAWKRALWQTCFLCLAGLLVFSVFDLKERFLAGDWNRALSANATEAVEVMAGEATPSSELERRPPARREPDDETQPAGSETGAPFWLNAPLPDSAIRNPHSEIQGTSAPAAQEVAEDVSASPTPLWWFWLGWAGGALALLARLLIARLALAGFCWRYRLNLDDELSERVQLLAGKLGLSQRVIVRVLYPRGSPATPLTPALSPRCAKGEGEEGICAGRARHSVRAERRAEDCPPYHDDHSLSLHPMRGEGARRAGEGCHLRTPIAFGLFLPSIALPGDFTKRFSRAEQDAMLAHELAHLAARDPLWYLLADVLCALLWWHPLVWWARSQLHTASELSADEASQLVEDGPQSLAGCLVRLAGELTRPAALESIGVEGDGFRSRLGRRVERLLRLADDPAAATAPRPNGWVKVLGPVVLLALLLTGTGWIAPDALRQPGDWQGRFHGAWDGLYAALEDVPEQVTQTNADNTPKKPNPATPIEESPEADTNTISAASRLVKDGQLLYEQGQHKEAEAKLREAIKLNPLNQPAYYYLSLIQEAEYADEARRRDEMQRRRVLEMEQAWQTQTNGKTRPLPSDYVRTNTVNTGTKARQTLLKKIDTIVLPKVGPYARLPLSVVVKSLIEDCKKADPEGKGVTMLINSFLEDAPTITGPAATVSGRVPQPQPRLAVGDVNITIDAELSDLPLIYALDVIVKSADQRIKYIVEDYAIVFTAAQQTGPQLYTRTFKVDPQVFVQGLAGVIARPLGVAAPVQQSTQTGNTQNAVAQAAPTPTSVRTNNAAVISEAVRQYFIASGVNLSTNQSGQSPMVFYHDRQGILMVRATAEDMEKVTLKVAELSKPLLQISIEVRTVQLPEANFENRGWEFAGVKLTNGLLADPQRRVLLRALEQRSDVKVESWPKVTTLSGRQAHLSGSNTTAVDVLAHLSPDESTMRVTAIASRGAITPTSDNYVVVQQSNVWSGATILLLETNKTGNAKGGTLHFITLDVIDPAGQPFNKPKEIEHGGNVQPVPPAPGKVHFYGEARGWVALKPGEKKHLHEALFGMGWTDFADLARVNVHRIDARTGDPVTIEVNVHDMLFPPRNQPAPKDFELQDGDRVQVPAKSFAFFDNQGAAPPPPAPLKPVQVLIEAKLAEISDSVARELGLLWFTANPALAAMADPKAASTTITRPAPDTNRVVSVNAIANMSALLTDAQFGALLRTLERKDGVDVLSAPRVTTLSGREALVEIVDHLTLVVGKEEDGSPVTRDISAGPKLHLLPTVTRDGAGVALDWQMTFNEFLGYDEPPKEAKDTAILPRVRERMVKRLDTVPDGQTLMVGWGSLTNTKVVRTKVPVLGDIPGVGRLFRGKKEVTQEPRHVLIFLSPVLVDENGQPVKP